MKRFFTFLFVCMGVFALNAQAQKNGVLVANFDDVPASDVGGWGGVTTTLADAPDGTPASGQMLVVGVPAGNPDGASFTISLNDTFDPRNYAGISFDAQMTPDDVSMVLKLQQSSDPGHSNALEDWDTWPSFSANGEWIEVQIPFDVVNQTLDDKYNADPSFPVDQYDQIEILPAGWSDKPDFTINLDNLMLRYDFDEGSNGIPLTKVAAIILTSENGNISAVGGNNAPVSLKVYSISGQEIANGVNQVQVGVKGAYIVKAATGTANLVQKIIVK